MRLRLSGLSKNFKVLDRMAKEEFIPLVSEKSKLESSPEEIKAARLSPARVRNLRKKLGISQRELATLAGVSMGAVVMWEKGKFKPKGEKKGVLIALRRLGKRRETLPVSSCNESAVVRSFSSQVLKYPKFS